MAIEITLTFGKDGLRIAQKLDLGTPLASDQNFVQEKRLKSSFAATQADQPAPSGVQVGGRPRDPGGPGGRPRDPGGPGGDTSVLGSSGAMSIIGPIVITTCSCLRHHTTDNAEEGEER